ncbi:MAG: EF-hand domain-containing protein [Deltaproteobacteria bacterium]|nr:MAG: EF-hand domain-containing protein [Deltaproteobacteria bacterium]
MNPTMAGLAFSLFDRDKDGVIDEHELRRALMQLGDPVDPDVVRAYLGRVDHDRSGVLSRAQFIELLGLPPPDPEVLRAFRALDLDGDGYVQADELAAMFAAVGIEDEAAMRDLVAELDVDGDGRVDLGEFLAHASEA